MNTGILILEASTSAAKAMVYTEALGVEVMVGCPYQDQVSDVATQNADGVVTAVAASGRKALEKSSSRIEMIGLVSVWNSLLLLDAHRRPVERVRTWAETSASTLTHRVRADEPRRRFWYRRSGCNPHAIYPFWKYRHLKAKQLEAIAKTAFVSSLPEYLFESLTGTPGTSINVAAGSGFLNIHDLHWDKAALFAAGLSHDQLGPLHPMTHTQPLSKAGAGWLGLSEGLPVLIANADGALNQIGENLLHTTGMTLSIGTSAAMRMGCDNPILPEDPATWCYFAGEGRWLAGAATAGAGNCRSWFRAQFGGLAESHSPMEASLTEVDPLWAPIFLPFLYGERSPGWDDTRRGAFCGLQPHHGPTELYYAILEGILFNLRQNFLAMGATGLNPETIVVSGGVVHSPFWLQMVADVLNRPILVSTLAHSSMLGGVAVALKHMGRINQLADFPVSPRKQLVPDRNRSENFRDRYQRYRRWYAHREHFTENDDRRKCR